MRCEKKNTFWHTLPFAPSWCFFFPTEKSCKLINLTICIKPENWKKEKERKKERRAHTTFHANDIVRFVLQAVRKFSFHNNKKFSWKSNYIVNALSYISFCIFDYSLFVISQEDEVVGSPSKGQVSKACNYWKCL